MLETEYGISLSHNRINESLRELSDEGVFRETVLPDRELFHHYLFRVAFYYPNFEDEWEDCYRSLVDDPHVLLFFDADSHYHWQAIAQFRTNERMVGWVHQFFKDHGDLLSQFHTTTLHSVHRFLTDATILDDVLPETEEGRRYLDGE